MTPLAFTAIAAALAALIGIGIGANAMALGRRLGVLDWPDPAGGRKLHTAVTPLMGGSAVVLATLAATVAAWMVAPSQIVADHLVWFAVSVALLYLIGLADDRFALGPKLRLVFGLVIFLLSIVYAPDFRLAFLRFGADDQLWLLGSAGVAFTVVCLVGLLNAVNMADGKDGLVISLSILWALLLWREAPPYLDPIFAALIVSLAITLRFNMMKQLFLGDGGSYGLSAILGMLAVYTYNHGFDTFRADRVALLFAVPVYDTIRLITSRALKRRSPFAADRDHLHHHIAYRWGWPRGLPIYLVLVGVPNLIALAAPDAAAALLGLTAVLYVALLVLSTRHSSFNPDIAAERHGGVAKRGGAR